MGGEGWRGESGEDADGDGAIDPSHGRRLRWVACVRVDGPCVCVGGGEGHLRSRVWRAVRPASAARDVAPDDSMLLELCLFIEIYMNYYESISIDSDIYSNLAARGRRSPPARQVRGAL